MKMWKGENTTVLGYWFRAKPDAEVIQRICSFRSWKTWNRGEVNNGVGEVTSNGGTYYKGMNREGYKGVSFCGSTKALLGGGVRGRDPEIRTDYKGVAPCCRIDKRAAIYRGCSSGSATEFGYETVAYGALPVEGDCGILIVHRGGTGTEEPDSVDGWGLVATKRYPTINTRISVYSRGWGAGESGSVRIPTGPLSWVSAAILSLYPANLGIDDVQFARTIGKRIDFDDPGGSGPGLVVCGFGWIGINHISNQNVPTSTCGGGDRGVASLFNYYQTGPYTGPYWQEGFEPTTFGAGVQMVLTSS